jgi:hypothetical protein
MTNKKNEHVLYLEERIEWLEKTVSQMLDIRQASRHLISFPYQIDFTLLVERFLEIQKKLPTKEIDKLDSEGGRA